MPDSVVSLAQLKADAKAAGWMDQVRTENDERALLAGYTFRPELGQHVIDFCQNYCKLFDGQWSGKPFILMDWQKRDLIMPLFSWVRPDGARRYRRASIWIPKKNGKSQLLSLFLLYGLIADGEEGAKIFCAANKREQAAIVWDGCAAMVKASPMLSKKLKIIPSKKRISKDLVSYLEALSADAKSSEGLKAHMWGIDEIHVFDSAGQRLREALRYAGRSRKQPMEVVISTAGDEAIGVGREEYEYASQVLAGTSGGGIDDLTTFAYIAEAGVDDDWTSPETWKKANPSLGTLISESDMADDCKAAMQSPRLQNQFKRYCLNLWTAAEQTALDMEAWKACGSDTFDPESLVGLPCCGGVDLSSTTDLTAFAIVFRHGDAESISEGDGQLEETSTLQADYSAMVWMFLPKDGIEDRERNDRMDYRRLASEGHLTLTPGRVVDFDFVKATILRESKRFGVSQIAYDPWHAPQLMEQIGKESGIEIVEIPQRTSYLNAACKLFESAVLSRRLSHGNNPVLNKMAADLAWYVDTNGNVRPMKSDSKKRRRRIDGIVATIMAMSRASVAEGGNSVYESRGLAFV